MKEGVILNKFKTNYKKVTSLLLVIIMLFSCVSFAYPSAFAAGTEYTKDGYTYTVSGSTAKIVAYTTSSSGKVTIPSKLNGYTVTTIGEEAFYACTTLTEIIIPNTVTKIEDYAFSFCISLKTCRIPSSVKSIGKDIFSLSTQLSDVYYGDTEAKWKQISINSDNSWVNTVTMHYVENIYNLGEETYSFDNFGDEDSFGGHCFGMSITSSGYYMGELDIAIIDGDYSEGLYSLEFNSTVKAPICYYHSIQGSRRDKAMVAGGSYYSDDEYDIESDWKSVVNYVKNHKYDGKGSLQIGFRKDGEGGHAINFLRYEVVDSQPRIYAYDNNYPEDETYFYKGTDGNIYQGVESTFSGAIDCIALRDVAKYFDIVGGYDDSRSIYADKDTISVENAKAYPMEGGIEMGERVVFEIKENVDEVKITPLVDNAKFVYCNKEYSFDEADGAYGVLRIADSDGETPELTIIKDTADNCSCNCHKSGIANFFFKLILFFQKLFKSNQVCKCGMSHY